MEESDKHSISSLPGLTPAIHSATGVNIALVWTPGSSPEVTQLDFVLSEHHSIVIAGLVPAISIPETQPVKQFYVYFIASRPGGALYVGVTSDLTRRIYEHKNGLIEGHTKRYGIDQLVYFEIYQSAYAAIQREKNVKHWPRAWKTRLIAKQNPSWRDLYDEITK